MWIDRLWQLMRHVEFQGINSVLVGSWSIDRIFESIATEAGGADVLTLVVCCWLQNEKRTENA